MNSINRIGLVAAILVIIAGAGWAAFNILGEDNSGTVALIKADNSSYKDKPQDAQGMDIPHQDAMVFNGSSGKTAQVEKIMPAPEQPMLAAEPAPAPDASQSQNVPASSVTTSSEASETKSGDSTAQAQAQAMGRTVEPAPTAPLPTQDAGTKAASVDAPVAVPAPAFDPSKGAKNVVQAVSQTASKAVEKAKEEVKQATQQEAPSPSAETPKAQPVTPVVETTATEKKVEAKPDVEEKPSLAMEPVAKQVKAQAKSVGGSRFQLASFNDRPSAQRAASQLSKKYNAALDGASLNVVQGSAHGRTVYRVQGTSSSASGVCSSIQSSGGSCMVVK